ncbi:MAG: hypothetical protein NC388_04010 [Clostridium sp.]|nr:hypothetical protein [Clostridium sp.]
MHAMRHSINTPWFDKLMWGFTHADWKGFSPWDLVMPLFMFMTGITIPFALSRYKSETQGAHVYKRILRRVVLLWLFGMMCQGNLLGLNPDRIYFYSNTLQAIAAGYLIAALIYLNTRPVTQIAWAIGLLVIYWCGMEFICMDGYGGGIYTPDGNFAEWVDRICLGRFRDGAWTDNGTVMFSPGYHYTWIWSTLTFGTTTLTGVFAGQLLKSKRYSDHRKVLWLLSVGIALVVAGWAWGIWHPVVKRLWTGSMVLVSSGYCWMLMGLFYYFVDYKGHRKHIGWLKVYGMNSIVAYMLACCVRFNCIGNSLLYGLEQYIGAYYPALIAASNALLLYFILWLMYKNKIFLKV